MRLNLLVAVIQSTLVYSLAAGMSMAADASFDLTIQAGGHDRHNTPVSVLVTLPDALAEAKVAALATADGTKLPGQLTDLGLLSPRVKVRAGFVPRQLHFVLPELEQGKSLKLVATVAAGPAPEGKGFRWKDEPGQHAELSCGGRPVLRYVYKALDPQAREETYKVFHHLYDPAGTRFVTKGPGGKYSHHRGLFFGFSRVSYGQNQRVDTWGCGGGAHQSHEGFLAQEAGPVLARHAVAVDWHGPGPALFAKEKRELTVYGVPGGQLVEFASRLSSTVGKVKLDGDPQHAGFQFRAAQEVADGDQKLTYYLRPDGKGEPGETRNWPGNKDFVNLPFNAMSFVIDGKRYTAVYLDRPQNPKEARFSERTYGRFGSYFVYDLDEGKDLAVNYRVWLQDGEMTGQQAASLAADFTDPVRVTVKQ